MLNKYIWYLVTIALFALNVYCAVVDYNKASYIDYGFDMARVGALGTLILVDIYLKTQQEKP